MKLGSLTFRNYFYFTSNFCTYCVEKTKSGKEGFLYFGKITANPLTPEQTIENSLTKTVSAAKAGNQINDRSVIPKHRIA